MKTNSLLDNLAIIVVEPKKPGNIGSIARACNNMGINHIILINPVEYLIPETFKLGWGSEEIINNITVVRSLDDILPDFNLLIGRYTSRGTKTGQSTKATAADPRGPK